MQRTLFDFMWKGNGGNMADAAAAALVTPGGERKRQLSSTLNENTAIRTSSPPRKQVKDHCEGSLSRTCTAELQSDRWNGASRDDAIDLDASLSVPLARPTCVQHEHGGAVDEAEHISRCTAAPAGTATHASSGKDSSTAPPLRSFATTTTTTSSSRWLAGRITSPEWRSFLAPLTTDSWRNGAFLRIERFLDDEREKGRVILPPAADIFNAFNSCPLRSLKVVLLGQDPYHDLNQAHGLCFSVLPDVPLPPSLRNIYKELTADIAGFQAPAHGYLQSWSEQGMLMLNATLTVEAHKANSHSKTSGWSSFTDAVIQHLSQHHPNRLVFLLWGGYAQQKKKLIDASRHVILESVHPSPLSANRGWFGCRCFSACNEALQAMGHLPMRWQLPLTLPRCADGGEQGRGGEKERP
ncbi:hypothetical protein LSCM1_06693 [Leishmania martiniquensis]|uniref:Uracil-DNA glycosylase n=1 Tax=Leishmania martiniquensis TaxID=1580590 RepID=A0A836GFH2_9TRYP|nr:hypothetical protein LSCM1_06693 [Leishmania martiniquensis]